MRKGFKEDDGKAKVLTGLSEFLVKDKSMMLNLFFENVATEDCSDIGSALFYTFDSYDRTKTLQSIALKRLSKLPKNEDAVNDCLRGCSLSINILSREIQCYGKQYLTKTLQPILKKISKKGHYEIDPNMGLSPTEVQKNLEHLLKATDSILNAIWKSSPKVPFVVKDSLVTLLLELQKVAPIDKAKLVASIFFLRFVCPFIVSPKVTDRGARRGLTLIAKIIQCIANGITEYETTDVLYLAKDYIISQIPKCVEFSTQVVDVNVKCDMKTNPTKSDQYHDASIVRIYDWLLNNTTVVEAYVRHHYGEVAMDQLNHILQTIQNAAPFGDEISALKRVHRMSSIMSETMSDSSSDVDVDTESDDTAKENEIPKEEIPKPTTIRISQETNSGARIVKVMPFNNHTTFPVLINWIEEQFKITDDKTFKLRAKDDEEYITDENEFEKFLKQQVGTDRKSVV